MPEMTEPFIRLLCFGAGVQVAYLTSRAGVWWRGRPDAFDQRTPNQKEPSCNDSFTG